MTRPPPLVRTAPLGVDLLSDGQVVTVLVGVGLDLVQRHRGGGCHGVIHPADLVVRSPGRPGLTEREAAPGWGVADDAEAWLRLACALARPGGPVARAVAGWTHAGERSIERLLPMLLGLAAPEPVVAAGLPAAHLRPQRRRGQHAARRRSWGPGTRTRHR